MEPVDAPEVREALREAESKGLGIVLLDAPLPATAPGKSYPYVTFQGFAGAAKQLVEAAIDDAKVFQLPPDGTILVLENREKDRYSRDRLDSITAALKAAGRAYDLVSFDGAEKGAADVTLDYLKTHPKLAIILADHDFGVAGAYDARDKWRMTTKAMMAIGGYYACDARLTQNMKERIQGLIDRNVEGYARKALELALDFMEGKPVPERAPVDVRFIHNSPKSMIPPVNSQGPPEGPAGDQPDPATGLRPRSYQKPIK
jgi:ABC-type sugar transport system substrate-binding protein